MNGNTILTLLIGVALGTYFHEEVSGVIPVLDRKDASSTSGEAT